jgi:hypothetical protein
MPIEVGITSNHDKIGKLEAGRFANFENYVGSEGHGLTQEEALEKARKGAEFLKAINEELSMEEIAEIGTREQNLSNLIWYLTKKTFDDRDRGKTPMDEGTYTLALGKNGERTKALHDYFAGENSESNYPKTKARTRLAGGFLLNSPTLALNIAPTIFNSLVIGPVNWIANKLGYKGNLIKQRYVPPASSVWNWFKKLVTGGKESGAYDPNRLGYPRESSHFEKEVQFGNKGNHFGYDVRHDENLLPGRFKTVCFGLMGNGRMYIKPEFYGMDPLHEPGEAFLHTTAFFKSAAERGGSAEARRISEQGEPGVVRALKEHRSTDPIIMARYKEILQHKITMLEQKIADLNKVARPKRFSEADVNKEIEKINSQISVLKGIKNNPKGDLSKLKALLGPNTGEISATQLITLNNDFDNMIIERYGDKAPQHGDENAFSIESEDLEKDLGSLLTKASEKQQNQPLSSQDSHALSEHLSSLDSSFDKIVRDESSLLQNSTHLGKPILPEEQTQLKTSSSLSERSVSRSLSTSDSYSVTQKKNSEEIKTLKEDEEHQTLKKR